MIVFYKRGFLKSVGAENTAWSPGDELIEGEVPWDNLGDFTFDQLKDMDGLGVTVGPEAAQYYFKRESMHKCWPGPLVSSGEGGDPRE